MTPPLILSCLCVVFALSAQEAPTIVRPTFSLAFHLAGEGEAAEARVVELNDLAQGSALPFSCGLSGIVHSDGPRIGGGRFGLTGTYYDPVSQAIMSVGGGLDITGPDFSFAGFPPGDYFLQLSVEGRNMYSSRLHLPVVGSDPDSLRVIVPKLVEISGAVEKMPIWAMKSPLVGCGPNLVALANAGTFKFTAPVVVTEQILLKLRFMNPFPKEWDQSLCRFEFLFPQSATPNVLHVPEVGAWKCCSGRIAFSDDLPAGLTPVLQNISIIAVSSDGSVRYRCNPDVNGNFLLVGLPDGRYSVEADPFGNPPFSFEAQGIDVKDHKANDIEVILAPIN